MSMTAGQTGASVSPVFVPDLRPTADAAALRRQAEPGLPVSASPAAMFPAVSPPSAVGQGEVGRSMLAAASLGGGGVEGGDERRLKPWGVTMLPHQQPGAKAEGEGDAASPATDKGAQVDAGKDRAVEAAAPAGAREAGPAAPAAAVAAAPAIAAAPAGADRETGAPGPQEKSPEAEEQDA